MGTIRNSRGGRTQGFAFIRGIEEISGIVGAARKPGFWEQTIVLRDRNGIAFKPIAEPQRFLPKVSQNRGIVRSVWDSGIGHAIRQFRVILEDSAVEKSVFHTDEVPESGLTGLIWIERIQIIAALFLPDFVELIVIDRIAKAGRGVFA